MSGSETRVPGQDLPVRLKLFKKLSEGLRPIELDLVNESPQHGLALSAEKHFRVVVVASAFEGLSRVERHRRVNELLAEELRTHVHALSIQAFTPEEWEKRSGTTFSSPACLGGGKREGIS